ncbi:hypothetical protein I5H01_gp066 [Mycobacterium phage MarkPhew]|uniref:Uncharacterized protein n=1 Tax=Mycobacterium phage MarkPhew TaxID=2725625 RepID=A0A6M3T8K0_9CAUD|nr:hypothetical protein I5H01_gp066 [Mycobacterium phage MarkPhew]QJD50341.1 hypothetical protein SEA_MARKPHEW_41 [Mycobacterium phage MarkPhew]
MLNTTYPMALSTGTLNGVEIPSGWEAQSTLAREAAEAAGQLDVAAWRTLLSAIKSGLPVVLVNRERDGRRCKMTVVVTWAVVHPECPAGNRIRVSYWGFGHDMHLADIESVATPDVEYLD